MSGAETLRSRQRHSGGCGRCPEARATDAALVLRARGGDQVAFERLAERYAVLIGVIAGDYFPPPGMERADLEQEGAFGLCKAVRAYRPQLGVNFRSFAALVIRRQVITALKRATRQKDRHLNEAYSFDMPLLGASDDSDLTLEEVLTGTGGLDAQAVLEQRDELATVVRTVTGMTELERAATVGAAAGLTYEQIAGSTGSSLRSIDNARQRGQRKIRRALEAAA